MLFVILLCIQILIGLALVGLILVQRSEGGALGIGGGGGGGFMSARGAGNLLTKATSLLAGAFFINCIALTIVGNYDQQGTSVVDRVGVDSITLDAPATTAPAQGGAQAPAGPREAAPSLTDLPAPVTVAPSAGTASESAE
ncbi:preprotein translocase subunit SecG [Asticcacaulis tiandongensis]|uniref:preprotein translocase subunit SecG n=1 Tax=Asticcacaulis tiandongensis TaxID=2565365 RepID=UPI001126EF17|nr:preprotein translocase subunit SecG [Asticcacaulis tiandongensis]